METILAVNQLADVFQTQTAVRGMISCTVAAATGGTVYLSASIGVHVYLTGKLVRIITSGIIAHKPHFCVLASLSH